MTTAFDQWVSDNISSQEGKKVLITGANSGIGYYTALGLAKAGADVVIAGRNKERVDKAVHSIEKEAIQGSVTGEIVDLASLESVRQFASSFNENHSSLDLLINNAGVMMPPESKTEDGFELQFGVNFLGHFLLTELLLNTLRKGDQARVVTVSSIAHRMGAIDFDNLRIEKSYDPRREYYQSKLANMVYALELGRRLDANKEPIVSIACHPGFTKTELQRHLDPAMLSKITFMDTWQGSLPTLVAASKEGVQHGDYFGPDGPGEISGFPAPAKIEAHAMDPELGVQLWETALRCTGIKGN